jgi:hypothetical protein
VRTCRVWVVVVGLVALAVSACGKKGPPLPPFVRIPDAPLQVTVRRLGSDVYLTFAWPTANIDKSSPVDVDRVDVYAYTATAPPPVTRFTEVATLIASISRGGLESLTATAHETLTASAFLAGPSLTTRGRGVPLLTPLEGTAGQTARAPLRRFYTAVALSRRNEPGPPSAIVELPMTVAPDAPPDARAVYSAEAATVSWEPSGGLVGFLLDQALPPPATALDITVTRQDQPGSLPLGPTSYNVYREIAPDPLALPPEVTEAGDLAPVPLNQAPISGFAFSDPIQLDERRRCYTVRAVRGQGAATIESDPSPPVCLTPIDTFPPAPPTGLSPIVIDGAVSLIWEANREPDIRGYIVWRGETGGPDLVPVSEEFVVGTRFIDEEVASGVRYVYAVTAVDTRLPQPNMSLASARVEVTAR